MASGVLGGVAAVLDGLERLLGVLQLRVGAGLAGLRGLQRLGGRGGVGRLAGGHAPDLGGLACGGFRFGGLGCGNRFQDLQLVGEPAVAGREDMLLGRAGRSSRAAFDLKSCG